MPLLVIFPSPSALGVPAVNRRLAEKLSANEISRSAGVCCDTLAPEKTCGRLLIASLPFPPALAVLLPSPNPHRQKAADEDATVDGVAVTNDVSRRYFPAIGLGELVRNPFRRWVRGHSQPQDLAAILMQYQQSVEQSERDCRDYEQVHRRDAVP